MLDIITLKGLTASGTHGVYDFEQREEQPFVVDVSIWVDISQASSRDDIDLTVSYADIAQDVNEIIKGPSVRLIETLADGIATRVLSRARVRGVEVTVHKPQAPIAHAFQDVCVRVRRGQFGSEEAAFTDEVTVKDLTPTVGLPALPADSVSAAQVTKHATEVLDSTSRESTPEEFSPQFPPNRMTVQAEEPLSSSSWTSEVPTDTHTSLQDLYSDLALTQPVPDKMTAVLPSRRSRFQTAQQQTESAEEETPFVLAFGGNQGNVPVTLVKALERLIDAPGLEITTVSPLLRTRAVLKPGMASQPDHWNAVVLGQTKLNPYDLLALCASIESELGRERPFEWAPRTIDIDIISMGEHIVDDDDLQLPHPRAFGRAFVLIPWFLADADASLPGYGAVAELIPLAPDRNGVIDAVEDWYENPETLLEDSDAILRSEDPVADVAVSDLEQINYKKSAFAQTSDETTPQIDDAGASAEKTEETRVATTTSSAFSQAIGVSNVPSFKEAITEEKTVPVKPRIQWKPVTESALPMTSETVSSRVVADSHSTDSFSPISFESLASKDNESDVEDEPARPLPNWNFSQTAVTIIDSTGDDQQDVVHSVAPKEQPQSRTILDPDLPEGTPVGTAPSFPTTGSINVQGRRHTMRPTHTGMIPVVKRMPPSA